MTVAEVAKKYKVKQDTLARALKRLFPAEYYDLGRYARLDEDWEGAVGYFEKALSAAEPAGKLPERSSPSRLSRIARRHPYKRPRR